MDIIMYLISSKLHKKTHLKVKYKTITATRYHTGTPASWSKSIMCSVCSTELLLLLFFKSGILTQTANEKQI